MNTFVPFYLLLGGLYMRNFLCAKFLKEDEDSSSDQESLSEPDDDYFAQSDCIQQGGELAQFYQVARTLMGQIEKSGNIENVNTDNLDQLLSITRIASEAPLLSENKDTPVQQMAKDFILAIDIRLKRKVMETLLIISEKNLQQQCSTEKKKEIGQLCSIYAAMLMKMMKEAYIPNFASWKKEIMMKKNAIAALDDQEKKDLEDRLSVMGARNFKIGSFIYTIGSGCLLWILLSNYPDEATKVFHYLKLAGYEKKEMIKMIENKVGRNKRTEFLYRSILQDAEFFNEKKQQE